MERIPARAYPLYFNLWLRHYNLDGGYERKDLKSLTIKSRKKLNEEVKKVPKSTKRKEYEYSAHSNTKMRVCDACHIGSGITEYLDGDYEHIEKELIKYKDHEFCGWCYEIINFLDLDKKGIKLYIKASHD